MRHRDFVIGYLGTRIGIAVTTSLLGVAASACGGGGGSTPTSPSSPPPPTSPSVNACGSLGITPSTAIINGAECPTVSSAVVLLNLRDASGFQVGSCSGTVIAPRAVLTAAHCLDGDVASVRVFPGSGPQLVAQSFSRHPNYQGNSSFDVGVVLMGEDLGRTPIPLLVSRDARMGEAAIVAGWGRDGIGIGSTLRAGLTTISAVGPTIQTQYSATAAAVCPGDSGGALLLQEGGVWAVAAVISANETTFCSFGANFYASIRNAEVTSFILDLVPNAVRQ